jgi:hypothetical protein
MSLPPARRMTSWAARGLCEEIAKLREDIHEQGLRLRNIDLLMQAIYVELHASNRAQLPD